MRKNFENLINLSEIDSTNNYANHLISTESAENGAVVLAQYQQKGRGQRDNYWESAPGKNLLGSIILYPYFLPVAKQFYLSKVTSLALIHWLKINKAEVSIKWPNDIYYGNLKIAGILIETSVKGNTLFSAVAGIGLNLNQTEFSSMIPNPVSLKLITGLDYPLAEAAIEIRDVLMTWFQKLKNGAYEEIDANYYNSLYRKNEWSWYREKERLTEARIIAIGEFGQLVLEDRNGNINSYLFKEVEFVL